MMGVVPTVGEMTVRSEGRPRTSRPKDTQDRPKSTVGKDSCSEGAQGRSAPGLHRSGMGGLNVSPESALTRSDVFSGGGPKLVPFMRSTSPPSVLHSAGGSVSSGDARRTKFTMGSEYVKRGTLGGVS